MREQANRARQIGLMAAAAGCIAAAAGADPLAFSNASGGSLEIYGQLSPIYLGFDDGAESYGNIADNDISNSRVGFYLRQQLDESSKLQFHFESSIGAPQSSSFSQDFTPGWTGLRDDLRILELSLTGRAGKLSVGQGNMATYGVPQQDLSRTDIAGYVRRPDSAGAYFFRNGSGDLSDISIGDVFDDLNGSRLVRLRYDTPSFNGFSLAAAYGTDLLDEADDNSQADVAVSYAGEVGVFRIAAAAGYAWILDPDDHSATERRVGSISALHKPSGLNATLAAGAESDGGGYAYGKLGWILDLVPAGSSAVSADYYGGRDFRTDGSTSGSWGLEAAQRFEKISLDVYAAWVRYDYSDGTSSYRDARSTAVGLRWTF